MISNGGDLLFVRKTHVIDGLSSTMRRYKLYLIRVDDIVTLSIWALVIVRGCMNKTKVHVELGTGLIHFASLSTCSALTDPSLHFPVYVSEQVEFE
jgi:hypothetical protein